MRDIESRVEDLLGSTLGCAFVAIVVESGLKPGEVAEPATALRAAAASADFTFAYNADHDLVAAGVRTMASRNRPVAHALIGHRYSAWWFADVDLQSQAWLPVQPYEGDRGRDVPPDSAEWHEPENPSSRWERYAQKPRGRQITSTVYGSKLTSKLIAYDERVGDHLCQFPMAWWSIRFPDSLRIFEIHSPSHWHDLCVRYPARGTQDDRLVPNWGAVSEEWDGVHLSLGGLLTAHQNRYESSAGWSMVDSWDAEQTYWLRAVNSESERQPDFQRGFASSALSGLRFPDLGGDKGTFLLRR